MKTREEERRERDNFYGDAIYEAYRRGMDVDRIDRDDTDRHYWEGNQPEAVADEMQRSDSRRRSQREYEEMINSEPQYPEEQS